MQSKSAKCKCGTPRRLDGTQVVMSILQMLRLSRLGRLPSGLRCIAMHSPPVSMLTISVCCSLQSHAIIRLYRA